MVFMIFAGVWLIWERRGGKDVETRMEERAWRSRNGPRRMIEDVNGKAHREMMNNPTEMKDKENKGGKACV